MREDTVRDLAIRYGVPANPVTFAATAGDAEAAAQAAGRPVAIKLVADGVVHKSKAGGVLLNVATAEAGPATDRLLSEQRELGVAARGVTVEPMVTPGLELVVGALHDPSFGPIVMVGAGGVDVEAVGDVAFALAPIDTEAAVRLLGRTRIGSILNRRFPGAHNDLARLLVNVAGRDGLLLREPVDQIDFNPIVVTAEGLVAVDARAVSRDELGQVSTVGDPADSYRALSPAIYPASLAVLGASADPSKLGHRAVRGAVDQGFRGPIHPVSRSAPEILGHEAVGSVDELPEGIDRAVVALPAAAVPGALRALAARGTRTAHVYTADTADLSDAVRGTSLRVLGPNSIGHYTPYSRLTMIGSAASSATRGGVAVVSQSGTYAGDVVRRGNQLGIRFSFASSVGNCDDVSSAELLAFCAADERTEIAAFYLEDDREAGRFFRLAATMSKPVVLFKGGRSTAGTAAAASHTGALAADPRLLRDAAAQAGVTVVHSLDELLDTLLVLQHVPDLRGTGLGLVGSGGGVAVVGADVAQEHGLRLATTGAATTEAMRRFAAPGTSLANPVDIPVWSLFDSERPFTGELVRILAADHAIDCVCAYLDIGTVYDLLEPAEAAALVRSLTTAMLTADRGGTPLVLVLRSGLDAEQDELVRELRPVCANQAVPLLDSVDRAIAALGRARDAARPRGDGAR